MADPSDFQNEGQDPIVASVECPQCGGLFETREIGEVQSHSCQVCGHAWSEVLIRKVKSLGVSRYMARARNEHPNLDLTTQRLLITLRAAIGNVGRRIPPIQCGTKGCTGRLSRVEPLLAQLLAGGWPTTGGARILCVECAKRRSGGAKESA